MAYKTTNFLQSNGFQLVVPSFPTAQFLGTAVSLPNVALPSASADSPFSRMAFAGDKMSFEAFSFKFIVDELMINYMEIFTWLKSISYATDYTDYTDYPEKSKQQPLGEQDIKVMILDSANNPIATVTFYNAIPISLSMESPLDTQVTDVNYVTGNVVFDYDTYDIELTAPQVYHKNSA